jgi:HSP20 family protein
VKDHREPLLDVMASDDVIRVIAEVPGVEKDDIDLNACQDTLTITVDTPHRKYYKQINLPDDVDVKAATSTYKNGILEVSLPKQQQSRGESINVE